MAADFVRKWMCGPRDGVDWSGDNVRYLIKTAENRDNRAAIWEIRIVIKHIDVRISYKGDGSAPRVRMFGRGRRKGGIGRPRKYVKTMPSRHRRTDSMSPHSTRIKEEENGMQEEARKEGGGPMEKRRLGEERKGEERMEAELIALEQVGADARGKLTDPTPGDKGGRGGRRMEFPKKQGAGDVA